MRVLRSSSAWDDRFAFLLAEKRARPVGGSGAFHFPGGRVLEYAMKDAGFS